MDLSKNNPLKSWVKSICQALYCLGVGNCWYEDKRQSNFQKLLYHSWMIISNVYNFSLAINVMLAHLRTDLDEKEQNDLIQFTFSNITITAKIFFLYLQKNSIQKVMPRVLEGFRSVMVCEELEKTSVRKSMKISFAIVGGTFMAMLGATIDGVKAYIDEGTGNFWYEPNPQTQLQRHFYLIWMIISNFYVFSFMVNVFLAYARSDLDSKEKNDLVQFSFSHTVISGKIIFLYTEKKRVVEVLRRLLEGNAFATQKLDKKCVKRSVRICVAVLIVSYSALFTYTIDGVRAHITEGVPIRTEVTYYPSKWDSGLPVNILRFFIQFHWWYAVGIMAAIDSICISSLVIVAHKFKVLQVYFTSLREKVLENAKTKSRSELEEEFRTDFVIGIKMHDDALWCAKNVQSALGNLYSVQISESVVLLVMCLIKLVTSERNLIFLLANFTYIFCLIFLTGAYMMPAGDITYEASMVSSAMFHSGWELATSRDTRVLVVLALQRSQAPVTMNAFGILMLSYSNFISVSEMVMNNSNVPSGWKLATCCEKHVNVINVSGTLTLSYSNFISVIRSSYSFFAVMY